MLKMVMYAELIGNYKNIGIKSLMGNKMAQDKQKCKSLYQLLKSTVTFISEDISTTLVNIAPVYSNVYGGFL